MEDMRKSEQFKLKRQIERGLTYLEELVENPEAYTMGEQGEALKELEAMREALEALIACWMDEEEEKRAGEIYTYIRGVESQLEAITNKLGEKEPSPLNDRLYHFLAQVVSLFGEFYFSRIDELTRRRKPKKDFRSRAEEEPSTHRAKEAFNNAIQKGFMERNGNGYRWMYNGGSKASLAFFLTNVYNPDGAGRTPYKALERLFNVKYLASASDQQSIAKKPQRWIEPLLALIKKLPEK